MWTKVVSKKMSEQDNFKGNQQIAADIDFLPAKDFAKFFNYQLQDFLLV